MSEYKIHHVHRAPRTVISYLFIIVLAITGIILTIPIFPTKINFISYIILFTIYIAAFGLLGIYYLCINNNKHFTKSKLKSTKSFGVVFIVIALCLGIFSINYYKDFSTILSSNYSVYTGTLVSGHYYSGKNSHTTLTFNDRTFKLSKQLTSAYTSAGTKYYITYLPNTNYLIDAQITK